MAKPDELQFPFKNNPLLCVMLEMKSVEPIRFRFLNRNQLQDFINSDEFATMPELPISRHRAVSHIHNPRANHEDILLILAYAYQKMVAYIGILPDNYYQNNGSSFHCGWLSCLWVDPECRGRGLSGKIIQQAVHCWNDKVILTEFVPSIRSMYDRTGLFPCEYVMTGIRLYFHFDLQTILPPKNKVLKVLSPVWKTIDTMFNYFTSVLLKTSKGSIPENCEVISSIDTNMEDFMGPFLRDPGFQRGAEELEWIQQYPWILKEDPNNAQLLRYYFSSIDRNFEKWILKVNNKKEELIAVLMFVRRGFSLKLPYCFYYDIHEQDVVAAIISQIRIHHIRTFSCFHPSLVNYFRLNKTSALFKKSLRRTYLMSAGFVQSLQGDVLHAQDGDGDTVFT